MSQVLLKKLVEDDFWFMFPFVTIETNNFAFEIIIKLGLDLGLESTIPGCQVAKIGL